MNGSRVGSRPTGYEVLSPGQAVGRRAPGAWQRSERSGARPRRIQILVTFAMKPGLETVMVSRTPARRSASKRRMCHSFTACATRRAGQPLPAHTTVMRAPRGARTVSRVTCAPEAVSRPLMRMTGNGRRMRGLAGVAGLTSDVGMFGVEMSKPLMGGVDGRTTPEPGVSVETGVGVGVGVGVRVGVGVGVGVRVGVGVGVGVRVGVGVGVGVGVAFGGVGVGVGATTGGVVTASVGAEYR
jgi:hypothetical protein